MVTYSAMFLLQLRNAMRGAWPDKPIENIHSCMTGTAAYFTDPENGQRYRITVEPIKATQEFKLDEVA